MNLGWRFRPLRLGGFKPSFSGLIHFCNQSSLFPGSLAAKRPSIRAGTVGGWSALHPVKPKSQETTGRTGNRNLPNNMRVIPRPTVELGIIPFPFPFPLQMT
jgi:hypothetical protein